MIPWLLVTALICETGKPLSQLVHERRERYPASGEINSKVPEVRTVMDEVRSRFADAATGEEHIDGLSMEFGDEWRFNLRPSQTEPILRLNVEAQEDEALMKKKKAEILEIIKQKGGEPEQ
jgi:phosphomannomutase